VFALLFFVSSMLWTQLDSRSNERALTRGNVQRRHGMQTGITKSLAGLSAQWRHMRWLVWSLITWR
jgi:hypothetical protein